MSDERREGVLARIERWTEWPQTALALLLIPLLLAPHLFALSAATQATLDTLDYLIWGLFVADLVVSLAVAPRRWHYLRTHWFDVALVVLPMFRPLRALRAFRALWALTAAERVLVGLRQVAGRRGLHDVLATALIVVLVAGSHVTIPSAAPTMPRSVRCRTVFGGRRPRSRRSATAMPFPRPTSVAALASP